MAIFDLYSKRQRRESGNEPDVYVYDKVPHALRVQAAHIIKDAIGTSKGPYNTDYPERLFKELHAGLAREYGMFSLANHSSIKDRQAVLDYLVGVKEYERALDIIELVFKYINTWCRNIKDYKDHVDVNCYPDAAIQELNIRFKENSVGYQFEAGQLIRLDSTYAHAEIVKPTIALLNNPKFAGANQEFLSAHEHYRHGKHKECLTDCVKALESTMKIICAEKGWAFNNNDTVKPLVKTLFDNGLIPTFLQHKFNNFQAILESGSPTMRNKLSAHGQGQNINDVDAETTRYTLNLTGSNIIYLVEKSGIK